VGFKQFRTFRDADIRHCSQSKWTVRVHVAALLAQIAHTRFQPCARLVRYHLNGGSEGISRMSTPVGPGFRRGIGGGLFPISTRRNWTGRILTFIADVHRARKVLQLILYLGGTGRILALIPKTNRARKVLQFNLWFDGARGLFGFNANHALVRGLRVRLGLPLSFVTLRSHKILMLTVWLEFPRVNMSRFTDGESPADMVVGVPPDCRCAVKGYDFA
jgi:hypothetical protein